MKPTTSIKEEETSGQQEETIVQLRTTIEELLLLEVEIEIGESDAQPASYARTSAVANNANSSEEDAKGLMPATAAAAGSPTLTVDWEGVRCSMQSLPHTPSNARSRCSSEDDPMGRLLLCQLLSKDPPLEVVKMALCTFPDSLRCNPAAYFTASRDASSEVLSHLVQHESTTSTSCCEEFTTTCPYPWILSEHVSFERAKIVVEACPEGVLLPSPYLANLHLLDYILLSEDMIQQRTFDVTMWNKFKLFLLVAECLEDDNALEKKRSADVSHTVGTSCCFDNAQPLPILLDLMLSRPDMFNDETKAQHVLWILHQLRWTDHWIFQQECKDGLCFPIHHVLTQKCPARGPGLRAARALVKIVLEAHPTSANHLVDGRLALHMALENGWPCHDLLLAIHPDALNSPDPKSGLFPFQTAALYDWCRGLHSGGAEEECEDADFDEGDEDIEIDGIEVDDGEYEMDMEFDEMASSSDEDEDDNRSDPMPSFAHLDVAYELLRANPAHACAMHMDDRDERLGAQVGIHN